MEENVTEFQKHIKKAMQQKDTFVSYTDPVLVLAECIANHNLQYLVEMLNELKSDTAKEITGALKRASEDINTSRHHFTTTLQSESLSFKYQLKQSSTDTTEKVTKNALEAIENVKTVTVLYLIMNVLIFIATMLFFAFNSKDAKAASFGLKSTAYSSKSLMGAEGSIGGRLLAAKIDINKGTSDEDLFHGQGFIKLFPTAPISFTANYEEAKSGLSVGQAFGVSIELKTPVLSSRIGTKTGEMGVGFDTKTYGIYDLAIRKAFSNKILIEPALVFAVQSDGKNSQLLEVNSQYKWSNKFDSVQSLGVSCGEFCSSPWQALVGIRYAASKNMFFAVESKTEPKTVFSPLPAKLANTNEGRLVTHKLKFATRF